MFPSSRSLDTRDAIEEERRLFYVAITRARNELYLTFPHMRLSGGYGDVFQRPVALSAGNSEQTGGRLAGAEKMTKHESLMSKEVRMFK